MSMQMRRRLLRVVASLGTLLVLVGGLATHATADRHDCLDPDCVYRRLPGQPAPPPDAKMEHLGAETAVKTAVDWVKFGKEPDANTVMDVTISAIAVAYPPAGIALGFAKSLIGGMAGGPDPVGEMLKVLNTRLAEVEGRLASLENEVNALRDVQREAANRERMRELLHFRDEVRTIKDELEARPTAQAQKDNLVRRAQRLAARFLGENAADADLWRWSDLNVVTAVRTDPRTGQKSRVPYSRWLEPDFKTLPTFEYYVGAVALWIAAIEWAGGGNAPYVTGNKALVTELLKHAAYLSVRPLWRELEADDPVSLPEQVMRRLTCFIEPVGRYPTNGACAANFVCADVFRRTRATVGTTQFTMPSDRTMCQLSVRPPRVVAPAEHAQRVEELRRTPRYGTAALSQWQQWGGPGPRVAAREDEMEREYGVDAMAQLADRLVRVARYGTTREQLIGEFDKTSWSRYFLYAVKPSGELLWYGHVIGRNETPPPAPGSKQGVVARPKDLSSVMEQQPAAAPNTGMVSGRPTDAQKRAMVTAGAKGAASPVAAPDPKVQAKVLEAAKAPEPRFIHQWEGPKVVSTGWQNFREIIPAGLASVYGLTPDGVLKWYRHDGSIDGTPRWKGPVDVGTGWASFKKIVAAGDGVLYGIGADGALRWYRHGDVADASARPSWSGPRVVGTGWGHFVHVFSAGEGVIYAAAPDGRLLWYRHKGYLTGATDWEGPREVGTGWAGFKRLFSPGDGIVYALQPNGELLWYQNPGYREGAARWFGPAKIAADWSGFVHVFPRMIGSDKGPVVR